ncbi:MAG: type II toxin-antitoxin system VapC family toxin [Solirubrobacterales bacterium]|nr:type II toxin-antitoxin system VapC family toxin [Solirubrobacterales bacterium]
MIVLDASVLIAHLDERDPHHDRAKRLLADSGAEPLGASTISLAETLVAPTRAGRLADATAALARLEVIELSLGEDASTRLARLRADTGRKLPDCCVLCAAQDSQGAIASFDSALINAAADLGLATIG